MTSADPLIGKNLVYYHIERLIGRGGMASVYYGVDIHLQRPAAIKVIDDRFSGDAAYATRLVHEARAMASWRHPNIPQVYQAGMENGVFFFAMEYIHGMDLAEVLRQYKEKGELLPYQDILNCARAIADALDYAHQKRAIHRDVKPANVLISEDDRILLTDFGLVLESDKGTQGEVFGSPQYISPEQARNSADAVPQSDIYSLGVILYEMLVGQLPFDDPSPASLAVKHITLEPPLPSQLNPDLSTEVEAVLLKALKKLPQERYQTGKELISALDKAIPGQSTERRLLPIMAQGPVTLPFLPGESGYQPPPTLSEPPASGMDVVGRPNKPAPNHPDSGAPGVNRQAAGTFPKNRALLAGIVIVGLLASLCVFFFLVQGAFNLLNRAMSRSNVQPSPTLFTFQSQTTPIASISTATATPVPLTPTPTASVIHLSLSLQKGDNFLMINQGTVDLPLSQLRYVYDKGDLAGTEWELDSLKPGQCVAVMKQEGHPAPLTGLSCQLVGSHLSRGGPAKFWDSHFDVYYKDVNVATCNMKDDPPCDVQFNLTP